MSLTCPLDHRGAGKCARHLRSGASSKYLQVASELLVSRVCAYLRYIIICEYCIFGSAEWTSVQLTNLPHRIFFNKTGLSVETITIYDPYLAHAGGRLGSLPSVIHYYSTFNIQSSMPTSMGRWPILEGTPPPLVHSFANDLFQEIPRPTTATSANTKRAGPTATTMRIATSAQHHHLDRQRRLHLRLPSTPNAPPFRPQAPSLSYPISGDYPKR